MNGATVARCPAASTNPEMPTTRLYYRTVLLFIMQPMAKDWEGMIFLSLATTQIQTLI